MTKFDKMLLASSLIASLAIVSSPATAQSIESRDPSKFVATLQGLGYKAVPIDDGDKETRSFRADIGSIDTAFVFGGCTAGKDCSYLLLVSSFSDVTNVPASWLNQINEDYDLVKLWTGDDKILRFRMAVPLGPDGVPLTTMRFVLDQWTAASGEIARSAISEKLIK